MKERIAKIVRIVTAPPIMVAILIVLLYVQQPEIFRNVADYAIALIALAVFPMLAYPIWAAIPKLKRQGRRTQRNLAFIGSLFGYTLAFLYGELNGATPELKLIFRTYFIAVVVLAFVNGVLKKKASGHACSVIAPMLFMCYFMGWHTVPACILLAAISFWGSLTLKRHKPIELFGGSVICAGAFICACLIYYIF